MATKFYLLNQAAPYTPTAWQGGWDKDGVDTWACDVYKFGDSAVVASNNENNATTPYRVGVIRLVSQRLAPQTISGTIDMVVALNEGASACDFYTRLHVYVVNSTTDAVLGTLLNGYEETSGGGGTEWTDGLGTIATALQSAQSLSSVTVPNDGDDYKLVFELGYRSENSDALSRNGIVAYGARGTTAYPDMVAGEAVNSLNRKSGFFQFSGTVSLYSVAPAHVVPEDAFDLTGLLPYSGSFTADNNGRTYSQWFTYTAPAGQAILPFFAFGDLSVYRPTTRVLEDGSEIISGGNNKALQIPLLSGSEYLIEVAPNAGNPTPANLAVDVQDQPTDDSLPNEELLLVPDDLLGVCVIVDTDRDNHVINARRFPPGEAGDILPATGVQVVENKSDGTVEVRAYDNTLLATLSINVDERSGLIRATPTLNQFFAVNYFTHVLKTIDPDGTISASHTIGDTHIIAIAVSLDGATLYYATNDDYSTIKRWDLAGGVALSDLAVGTVDPSGGITDILILADGTVLVMESHFGGDPIVQHYAADGSTLHTYTFTGIGSFGPPRIARGANDSVTAFWVWVHPSGATGISRYQKIQISDGAVLNSIDVVEFEEGVYSPDETPTPLARTGVSSSCPFFVFQSGDLASITAPSVRGPSEECCPCEENPQPPAPGQSPTDSAAPLPSVTGAILPPTFTSVMAWVPSCAGGGDVPTAADATDAESWVS